MKRTHYKSLVNKGKFFVNYNISRFCKLVVYKDPRGGMYAKTRDYGQTINGITNLVACTPCTFGIINGYKEIN